MNQIMSARIRALRRKSKKMTRTGFKAFPGRWLTCTAALASALALSLSAASVFAQDPRLDQPNPESKKVVKKKADKKATETATRSLPPPGAAPSLEPSKGCLSFDQVWDKDGDFERNREKLESANLCIKQHVFKEGELHWVLQIIQNKEDPDKFFWFVPHDNEQAAFNTAVHAVTTFGGTVVAVETGGHRRNGPQDPNRNFDADTGLKCKEQVAPSPKYTKNVMRWYAEGAPIVALHTNSGTGGISISKPLKGPIPFRAAASATPVKSSSPDHTLIFVASERRPENDPHMNAFVKDLNKAGIHVLYETVSRERNDCSFSNYAALTNKNKNYINIEVVEGDGRAQVDILARALPLLAKNAGAAPPKASQLGGPVPPAPVLAKPRRG